MMDVERVLANLPENPGVYIMKDIAGKVIYVGKAKVLKKRVRSYFVSPVRLTGKTRSLVEHIDSIEYILADSEMEALILECNLIKQYRPKYNILLKDDKGYPYIRINMKEAFPMVELARTCKDDGARYFGPYLGTSLAREIVDVVNDTFPMKTCAKELDGTPKGRPCLRSHLGKCVAPCRGMEPAEYRKTVGEVMEFLRGGHQKVLEVMHERMLQASSYLDFERAAELRDKITRIEKVMSGQKATLSQRVDLDVAAVAMEADSGYACVQLFFLRAGRMIGAQAFELTASPEDTPESVLSEFIGAHYGNFHMIPPQIVTPVALEDQALLEQYLSEKRGSKVSIGPVARGSKRQLAELARKNAEDHMRKSALRQKQERAMLDEALNELAQAIGLDKPPYRIEAFDISNTQGVESVASMVVFEDGLPANGEYRRFKIKTVIGPNDFASMQEAVGRRFRRAKDGDGGWLHLPDLLLIDGGFGQLHAAMETLNELQVHVSAIGLAKRMEEICMPDGRTVILSHSSPALRLLQRVRDEAHRFAITYHRSLRTRRGLLSLLEDLPGIGEVRRKALYRAFGSVERISEAAIEDLAAVNGMNQKTAAVVFEYFRAIKNKPTQEEQ